MIIDSLTISRAISILLRLYNLFFGNDPLQNAPYGACSTDSDALSWIEEGNVEQTCISHESNNTTLKRCWYKYEPLSVTSLRRNTNNYYDNSTSSSQSQSQSQSQSIPLVIHLHGAGGCASLPSLNLGSLAEKEQFVLIWPQGTFNVLDFPAPDFVPSLNLSSWNDGSGLFGAEQAGVDDLDFLNTMIETVLSEDNNEGSSFLLNPDRIYLSGHSNGATMAQRFILQSSQERKIAGVMAFAGAGAPNDSLWSPGGTSSEAYEATPIIHISGTLDGVVPFYERRGPLAGALQSLEAWAELNNCTNYEVTKEEEGESYVRHFYGDCESPVQLLEIPGAGHHPFNKGKGEFEISPVNTIAECPFRGIPFFNERDCTLIDLDTTQLAWDYISQFSLSSP